VTSVGDLRTFERDDGEDGRVINVELADETGRIRAAMWDAKAEAAAEELEVGQVLRVAGRPKEGYNGLEVNVDDAEPDDETAVDVQVGADEIGALSLGQSDVTLAGVVLDTDSVRTFDRDDGSEGRVGNFTLGDETGRVRVTLWDERTEDLDDLAEGDVVEVIDGYVRERDGQLELHVGNRGAIEDADADVTYVPETTPIAELELEQTADIAGVVRSADPKRTFDRDDGSEGQVRNVRVQDDSGDIRVALWGEKADKEIGPGDEVVCADVEIQDGWQEELEASAGWRSTVSKLETGTATGGGTGGAGGGNESGGASEGLGRFADGAAGDDGSAASGADDGGTDDADDVDDSGGATVEFTGTVVQTGDPVMVDDGEEAVTVDTAEEVRLGQEVTVRGTRTGDQIEADDVF
jgi:replication factor A1